MINEKLKSNRHTNGIQPLVSIIIPCFNGERYIDKCLESLIQQTYQNFEIVVCDDNSSDNSYRVLESYQRKDSRIILLKNEKNLYAAAARNKCIRNSKGKFILIQDVDDISEKSRIETLLSHLKSDEVDFVSSGMIGFNDGGQFSSMKKEVVYPQKKHFLWGLPFFHPATMFKRDCLEAVGGYRVAKETRRGEDYDLFIRLYAVGFRGKNISDRLYWYRVDEATIKRRSFSARLDECKLRYKGFKQLGLLPIGLPYVIKPLFAHLFQLIKYRSYYSS